MDGHELTLVCRILRSAVMDKRGKYTDISVLVTSIFLVGLFISWQITNGSVMINTTIGAFLFIISLIFRILKLRKGQYLLFILLLALLFNIRLSFRIANGDVSTTYYSERFPALGFNPIIFLVLILYVIVHRNVIISLFRKLFYGSEKEQDEKRNKNIAFYYDKFSGCSSEELESILKMYEDYPAEAQIALKRIQQDRKVV
jgi:hypothetical protein